MEKFTNRMDLRNDRISGLESNIQELKHSVNYKDKLIKNTWRKPLRSIGHHRKPKSVIHAVPSFLGHLCLSTPDRALQTNTMILSKSSLENQWVLGLQKTDDSQAAESLRSPFCMGNDSWKLRSQSSPQDPQAEEESFSSRVSYCLYHRGEEPWDLESIISAVTRKLLLLPKPYKLPSFPPRGRVIIWKKLLHKTQT